MCDGAGRYSRTAAEHPLGVIQVRKTPSFFSTFPMFVPSLSWQIVVVFVYKLLTKGVFRRDFT
eukprot:COSAG06_NODE_1367_length_9687_cov_6.213496_9_plen_63_part_00